MASPDDTQQHDDLTKLFDNSADDDVEDDAADVTEDEAADDVEDEDAEGDDSEASAEGEPENTTDSLLQKLVDAMQKNPAGKPEDTTDSKASELPAFAYPGVAIPDDVKAALDSEDPATRHKAMNHVLSETGKSAANAALDYMQRTFLPAYTTQFAQHMMQTVQSMMLAEKANAALFADKELSIFQDDRFRPILQQVHSAVSRKHNALWNKAVHTDMVKQLKDLKRSLSAGKDTTSTKVGKAKPASLRAGKAVRQTNTTATKKSAKDVNSGELTALEQRAFFS